MKTANVVAAALAFALRGCMTERTKSLFNPPAVHPSTDQSSDYAKYGDIPITQYYAALEAAKDTDDDFWASGATSVTWTKQSNGLWTVAASFPPSGGSGGAGGRRPR